MDLTSMNSNGTMASGVYGNNSSINSGSYDWSWIMDSLTNSTKKTELTREQLDEVTNNIVERLLNSDEDLMFPVIKQILIGCLDKISDNPEEFIKESLENKKRIEELTEENKRLAENIKILQSLMNNLKTTVEELKNKILIEDGSRILYDDVCTKAIDYVPYFGTVTGTSTTKFE